MLDRCHKRDSSYRALPFGGPQISASTKIRYLPNIRAASVQEPGLEAKPILALEGLIQVEMRTFRVSTCPPPRKYTHMCSTSWFPTQLTMLRAAGRVVRGCSRRGFSTALSPTSKFRMIADLLFGKEPIPSWLTEIRTSLPVCRRAKMGICSRRICVL
jgi:hypothetical protein